MKSARRVAILHAEWPVQSQTVNAAEVLAQSGFIVELFLYKAPCYLINLPPLSQTEGVIIHDLSDLSGSGQHPHIISDSQSKAKHAVKRILKGNSLPIGLGYCYSKLRRLILNCVEFYLLLYKGGAGMLPKSLLQTTLSMMSGKTYVSLIGIERMGLIWAGMVAEHLQIPFFYYSLELYTQDHPDFKRQFRFKRSKLAEQTYHRRSYATIIQDSARAEVLLKDTGAANSELLFVPVSLLDEPFTCKTKFFHERFGISPEKKIILQFGNIWSKRFNLELAQVAQCFPKNWVLVMHNFTADTSIVEKIRKIDRNKRVILSLDAVDSCMLKELVASADIGLAFYRKFPINDYLTGFSSEKLALYLQTGLPVVTFDYPSYKHLTEKYKCGICIKDLQELPQAIERILSSYEDYRQHAFECYREQYEFSRHFKKVIERIDGL